MNEATNHEVTNPQSKKVVLITGGAMGQGRAHAVKFAENGFNVVLADMLDPADARYQETVTHLEQLGAEVLAVKANICSTPDMENLFASAWERFGRLDVVIANAGVINFGYTWELTDEQVEKVINIDLIGTWRTDKYAAQYMIRQGFGRIINISSVSGVMGNAGQANYCASKAGLIGLTKSVARELGSRGITVNAVAPGFIKTEMTDVLPEDVKKAMGEQIPLKRFGETKDIAETVAFLASEGAAYITGQVISVDGGMAM